MIERNLRAEVDRRLKDSPAVALLGPRQVGKTTLARAVAAGRPDAMLLDLERPSDRAALQQPELFFEANRDRFLVLDEIQLVPDLFAALRPEIDADRRAGRFLLLGSASGDLLRQSGESLAGRVSYLELTPLLAAELPINGLAGLQALWLRGGFPLSYLARNEEASYAWRQDFIRTFLQRDLPGLGVRVPAETLSGGNQQKLVIGKWLATKPRVLMLPSFDPLPACRSYTSTNATPVVSLFPRRIAV